MTPRDARRLLRLSAAAAIGLVFGSLAPPASSAGAAGPPIRVEAARIPAPPGGARTAAGYLTVVNGGAEPDVLVSAESPTADRVEIHDMSMSGGIMRMRPVAAGLTVPAHGSLVLKPGDGPHLMFVGLRHPLKAGARAPVALRFRRAGVVAGSFRVIAPGAG